MDRMIQSDDCSNSMVVISHPGINLDRSELVTEFRIEITLKHLLTVGTKY